jgi:two-component system, NarL family, invasion response regulator UvrY
LEVKILIADDHPIIREGLKSILEREPELKVEAQASSADEIFESLQKTIIDLILLDISLPGKSGLDVIKNIKELYPDISILIISMHPEETFALRCLKLGASGYLTKNSAADDLVTAVRKIIAGEVYLSSKLSKMLVNKLNEKGDKLPHENLSDREFQVLRMLASGKTVSQVAGELYLSIATVSTYRSRILEKMNLKTNAELVHYVISNNLNL